MVTTVVAHPQTGTLLLDGYFDVTAMRAAGIAWRTVRLCMDDLEILSVSSNRILCSGDFVGATEDFVIDLASGEQIDGRRFRS
jgi:hypothetical protein